MDIVYAARYDNMESYEDNLSYVDKLFTSYSKAEKYVFSQGYTVKTKSQYAYKESEYVYTTPAPEGYEEWKSAGLEDSEEEYTEKQLEAYWEYEYSKYEEYTIYPMEVW